MPKCSNRILTPIKINIIPPASSALSLYLLPKIFPTKTPMAEIVNVVAPMIAMAGIISTFKNAKVIPTASASMLVAIARRNSSLTVSYTHLTLPTNSLV